MYRFAVKRLLAAATPRRCDPHLPTFTLISRGVPVLNNRFSTSAPDLPLGDINNPSQGGPDTPPGSHSQTSESGFSRSAGQTTGRRESRNVYEEEQARILQASLAHVNRLGWSEAAMMAGARDVGLSPSIVGSFPRKEALLVEYFMDDCLQRLIDKIDSDEDLKILIPSERILKLTRHRLEMQIPYVSTWAQALSIQALPMNISMSFKQRAMLVDEIWHAAGDASSDIDWYVKRTVLSGIYSTTEVYMLADNSLDFRDTWAFLDARVRDAFDMKKTMQEAKYLVDAFGAGLRDPFQRFVKKAFEGRSSY